MYINKNNKFLKTKIVASLGPPRGEIYDPGGNFIEEEVNYDRFLNWFLQDYTGCFMVDVIRLNMSFFTDGKNELKFFKWLKDNKNGLSKNIAVSGDLAGPKMRLSDIEGKLLVEKGEEFKLSFKNRWKKGKGASVLIYGEPLEDRVYQSVCKHIRRKEVIISTGDGKVILKTKKSQKSLDKGIIGCIVEKGGEIKRNKGLTIKGLEIDSKILPSFQKKDEKALKFFLENADDFLAFIGVSFVRNGEDVLKVKKFVENHFYEKLKEEMQEKPLKEIKKLLEVEIGRKQDINDALRKEARLRSPMIIAKIETRESEKNICEILDVADGIMVARGDLGLQLDPEEVPAIQKKIIRLCNFRGKPVITATEMLSSMEENMEPTRAEATDVFNAIVDGSDAVMLSGETSNGKYPAHAVRMMIKIAEEAEKYLERPELDSDLRRSLNRQRFQEVSFGSEGTLSGTHTRFANKIDESIIKKQNTYRKEKDWYQWILGLYSEKLNKIKKQGTTDSISESACILAEEEKYHAIVASTLTGRTARMISRFRPDVDVIIGVVHDELNARKLMLSFGVYPINIGINYKNGKFKAADEVFESAIGAVMEESFLSISSEELFVFIAGTPVWELGEANLIQIKRIPHKLRALLA